MNMKFDGATRISQPTLPETYSQLHTPHECSCFAISRKSYNPPTESRFTVFVIVCYLYGLESVRSCGVAMVRHQDTAIYNRAQTRLLICWEEIVRQNTQTRKARLCYEGSRHDHKNISLNLRFRELMMLAQSTCRLARRL